MILFEKVYFEEISRRQKNPKNNQHAMRKLLNNLIISYLPLASQNVIEAQNIFRLPFGLRGFYTGHVKLSFWSISLSQLLSLTLIYLKCATLFVIPSHDKLLHDLFKLFLKNRI